MLLLCIKLFRVSQEDLILVLSALMCFTDIVCVCGFFPQQTEGLCQPCGQSSMLAPFSQEHLLIWCLSVTFW